MDEYKQRKLIDVLNIIADYIIRIVLVNILVILTSLPIITIIPSIKSGFKVLSDYTFKDESPIIKTYFKTFSKSFSKSLSLSLTLLIVLGASYLNNRLYSELIVQSTSKWYVLGYYITLVVIIGVLMVSLYLPLVLIEKDELNYGETLKLAFYLSGKYFFRTFLMTIVLLLPILMFTTPFLMMLFIFMGVSIPLQLHAYILKKVRIFVRNIIVVKNND